MAKKLGLGSIIVTAVLVIASLYILYHLYFLNTDFGEHNAAIRLFAIFVFGITLMMVSGCIVTVFGLSKEDLESMTPK